MAVVTTNLQAFTAGADDAVRSPSRSRVQPQLRRVTRELDELLADLDPQHCDAEGALELLTLFARVRKAGAAGEAVVARRVEECGAHRRSGHRSTAHLLAEVDGTTVGHAQAVVDTATALPDRPETAAALRVGAISIEQAHAVTSAAAADPSAEGELLACAGRDGLRRLRERARDVRLAAEEDRLGRYERQRAARSLRHGRDDDGMVWGHFRLPPDSGAIVVNRLERQADREYRAAGAGEQRARHEVHLADALVTLCTRTTASATDVADTGPGAGPEAGTANAPGTRSTDGTGSVTGLAAGAGPAADRDVLGKRDRRADLVVHVSHEALRRGRVGAGEMCMVQGAGPVPIEVARDLLEGDAFLKGVLVDGTDVLAVRHFGRHRPAELQTALEVRAVRGDGDVVCAVEGCDQHLGIEWDHENPHAAGGATSYANLRPLCRAHHRAKTARDRATGPVKARGAGSAADDRAPP